MMDLQCSNLEKDNPIFNRAEFESLLEVRGNFFKKLFYRNVVKIAKEFYNDYVNWCEKNNKYIEFIQPLAWHLFCCGISNWKIQMYMENIRGGILQYIRRISVDD